ncbi:rhodanese-like domain-containing protein [Algibacter miyuki]|uniref:Rhodanese-like domain-containing protein n=1 Tax=Algibacter miyuki TaxID=1306933 RepID=A0ABV5GXH1_9FLAO|nr:rhodanese-like domain-containing protein [Algibacter miyuki]MDN3665938.1 rhodanese-like domain-containing protein [Algibacter miyuki]
MKQFKLITLSLIFCALMFSCNAQNNEHIIEVSPEELQQVLKQEKDIRIIDVRTPEEFEAGHIEGAENINFFDSDFETRVGLIDNRKSLVIYCKSGRRSGKSQEVFTKLGFNKIYNLEGGILGWKSEGFKTK